VSPAPQHRAAIVDARTSAGLDAVAAAVQAILTQNGNAGQFGSAGGAPQSVALAHTIMNAGGYGSQSPVI
jgi:hypothetical protein